MEALATENQNQYVVFTLQNEKFGINVLKVREIIRVTDITSLPDMADFMEGIINLRGDVIPVIDLRVRFGIPRESAEDKNRILLADINNMTVGLIVDTVQEVLRVEEDALTTYEDRIGGTKAEYIEQIGKIEDMLLIILDVEKVLSTDEKSILEDIAD